MVVKFMKTSLKSFVKNRLSEKELELVSRFIFDLEMDKDKFISFINIIYDKRQRIIDYDTIHETEEEYSLKGKIKKILYINR